jgi:hypothetical protein
MIDQNTIITKTDDLKTLQKIFDNVHQQATGIVTSSTTAVSADMVPTGKLLIADDGTTLRIYVRTGTDSVGYLSLTKV